MDDSGIIKCEIPTDKRFLNLKQDPPKVFGRLTVLEYAGKKLLAGRYRNMWKCECSCGNITIVKVDHLTTGRIESCGCLQKEVFHRITHHMSDTDEYNIRVLMIDRCYNPKNKGYANYGGRGIIVCERWLESIVNFVEDMGPRLSRELSIDRIDNNGNYEPGNCKWATNEEQNNNQRTNIVITARGKSQTAAQWGRELNINSYVLRHRYHAGWNHEDIINTPIKCKNIKV